MIEMLSFPFMQRAIVAAVILGVLASYFGAFIVQRGLGFLGDGLAHAAFGGVALGLFLGQEPLWVALPFTVFVAVGITWLRDHAKLREDTAVGIFFAVSVALGVVFLSLRRNYNVEAYSYLFGSILAVNKADLLASIVILAVTVFCLPLWTKWAYSTFDRELAQADGVHVVRDDYLLAVLIAISVVIGVKTMGIVLISSFLVIPAATAKLVTRTFFGMTILSIIIGAAGSLIGLMASYWLDIPSGATITLTEAGIFSIALVYHMGTTGRV